MKNKKRIGVTLAAAAALAFVAAPAASFAETAAKNVPCYGANACKGMSACKTAKNACKGHNSCKGQGMMMKTAKQCKKMGGSTKES